jgi:hypothetical protein
MSKTPHSCRGEVVATELLARACGCVLPFHTYAHDPYTAERRAKFLRGRCPEHGRAKNQADNARQLVQRPDGRPKKGREIKLLPPQTLLALRCDDEGRWFGSAVLGNLSVGAEATSALNLLKKLAVRLLTAVHAAAKETGGTP